MRIIVYLFFCCFLAFTFPGAVAAQTTTSAESIYTTKTPSRDGIGKVYFGREISQVMGHRGAAWLERQSRVRDELPDLAVQAMELSPVSVVADIGAGTGYFTFRMASYVPEGRVYAVDIQPEMLAIIRERMLQRSVDNIVPVKGRVNDPMLPSNSIDAALFVDAYHEFSHPYEMMQGIVRALRPGGRVYLIEYRGEDPAIPIKRLHKMTQQQAITEMKAVGLKWLETRGFLPTQHFMIFEKQGDGSIGY
ncbi:MAG: class I SAM-dependent methyltransferase [Gammaproteobacteria bacterium]|nr:class I SAM-dependent methyltransferase [Gammaproteobacteria bacterium]